MLNLASDIRIQKFLQGSLALTTILVMPNYFLDAVNLPKLLVLSIFAFTILGALVDNIEEIRDYLPSGLYLALILFVSTIVFAVIANGPNWNQFLVLTHEIAVYKPFWAFLY